VAGPIRSPSSKPKGEFIITVFCLAVAAGVIYLVHKLLLWMLTLPGVQAVALILGYFALLFIVGFALDRAGIGKR
jgi:hypothetical protein